MSLSISVGPPTERSGLLYGRDDTPNLIGFGVEGPDRIRIFIREKEGVNSWTAAFEPFLFLTDEDRLKGWKGDCRMEPLAGYAKFRRLVSFPDLATLDSAKTYLQKKSGKRLTDPGASYLYFNDPIQQHLLTSGSTHFLGMRFADLRRMQIDLETYCDADFEFPNAERESDRITAIAMSDTMGWERVITGREFDEAEMIAEMVGEIQRRDPDVLEGHNFFRFDLRYLRARAKRYGLELNLGRNGSTLKGRSARMDFGDRRLSFMNYEIFGRHVIDTWFLAQRYDLRTSELEGHGLKDVARHFGVVPAGRTYIPGEKASWYFDHEPDTLFRYALDDVRETRAVSDVLSPPYFLQAQIFPCTYQHVALQDDVSKIDTLLLREYLAQRRSIPAPMEEQTRVVALPDFRFRGVEKNVQHGRVVSLHSSIMSAHSYFPKNDDLGILARLLQELACKTGTKPAADAENDDARTESTVLAATCEILLSSLHPYLSCPTGHFNDFDVEGKVTAEAQKVMASVAQWLERRGARIIGVEADGIYFAAAPSATIPESESHLARELAKLVPAGAELRLDGPYPAMFSYDPKNHALLDDKGRIRVTGSVLYPRGLERFRRNCLEEMFRLLLEGNKREIPALYGGYREALETHEFDIALLMKTETLQESLADYQMRVKGARRNPRGVYEIALRSGRDYLEGDQVSYYVTGDGAKVKVNEHCRHVSEWDRHRPDENVEYYKARLRELYEKFQPFVMEES